MKIKILILVLLLFLISSPTFTLGQAPTGNRQPYDLITKINEAKQLLEPIVLTHDDKISRGDFKWKDAALAVMDPLGGITIIKIRKEGQTFLCLTGGFFLNVEERPSDITYNGKNTAFLIKNKNWQTLTVIGIKWLETDAEMVLVTKGRKRHWVKKLTVTPILYVPYSTGLHQQELIKAGDDYYNSQSQTAYDKLDQKQVKSLVDPSKNVTETIPREWIKNLFLIEQADPKEYKAFRNGTWNYSPYERDLVRLGANGKDEFKTKNYAGAVGLMQFTNNNKKRGKKRRLGTWDIVRTKFPSAQLPAFSEGSIDHTYSIMAAVLLEDLNTLELVENFGPDILQDPQLEFYLAAGYNGGIGRVITGVKKYGLGWTRSLKEETRIYVKELEYLKQHPINPA